MSYFRNRILSYIDRWTRRCYHDGIPDEAPERLEVLGRVPSYKRIVFAILKNDLSTIHLAQMRTEAYDTIKKIELRVPRYPSLFDESSL